MTPILHPEIWMVVISHLRFPTPRKGCKRREIRQRDLAVAMRVNKMFYSYAAPLLYTNIITDNISSLVYNINQLAASDGVKSKAELFGYTRRLFLEYSDKSAAPSHPAIHAPGYHVSPYRVNPFPDAVLDELCGAESDEIKAGAELLTSLPKLDLLSVSTGAYLGPQIPIYMSVMGTTSPADDIKSRATAGAYAVSKLITKHEPDYFCQHTFIGPLSFYVLPPSQTSTKPRAQQHRAHLHPGPFLLMIPIILGGVSRWYFSAEASELERCNLGQAILMETALHYIRQREQYLIYAENKVEDPAISVEIYLPQALCDQPGKKEEFQESMGIILECTYEKAKIPASRYANDTWAYSEMDEAPVCEGCGWSNDI